MKPTEYSYQDKVEKRMNDVYDDIPKMTIKETIQKQKNGEITAEELTSVCLKRISDMDKNGPCLNAIIEVNPHANEEAVKRDKEKRKGIDKGKLHGIPILLKDNIATGLYMHTTAGAFAMRNAFAKDEAPLVKKLKEAGAIIIGKTNLTEWANFISSYMPNGYSTLGGQTQNYYNASFEVGGSSSGSAVGVSAGYALAAIGTETSGSIVKPAINSGLVGVKPSKGFISAEGIIPIAPSQDTAGVITKTVEDAALVLSVIADADIESDNFALNNQPLNIALVTEFFSDLPEEFAELIKNALQKIKDKGHHIIKADTLYLYKMMKCEDEEEFLGEEVLFYEFGNALADYLAEWTVNCKFSSLEDLILFNEKNKESAIKYGQDVFKDALKAQRDGGISSPTYKEARARDIRVCDETGLHHVFEKQQADVVVFPHYYGCTIPARAGYPSVTIPVGCGKTGFTAITVVGKKGKDFRLLNAARELEVIIRQQKKTK